MSIFKWFVLVIVGIAMLPALFMAVKGDINSTAADRQGWLLRFLFLVAVAYAITH